VVTTKTTKEVNGGGDYSYSEVKEKSKKGKAVQIPGGLETRGRRGSFFSKEKVFYAKRNVRRGMGGGSGGRAPDEEIDRGTMKRLERNAN